MEHKLKSNMAVMFHDVLSGVSRGNGDSTIAISVAIRDDIPRVTLKGQRIVYGSVTQVFLSNYVYEGAPVETHCFIQSRTPDDRSGILLYTDKTAYPYVTWVLLYHKSGEMFTAKLSDFVVTSEMSLACHLFALTMERDVVDRTISLGCIACLPRIPTTEPLEDGGVPIMKLDVSITMEARVDHLTYRERFSKSSPLISLHGDCAWRELYRVIKAGSGL